MFDSWIAKGRGVMGTSLPGVLLPRDGTSAASATRGARRHALLVLGALLIPGCDGDIADVTRTGTLRMTVTTSGADVDTDGYELIVNGSSPMTVTVNGTVTTTLPVAIHFIELRGVADNCLVDGGNTRSVTVAAGDTVQVSFAVTCAATTVVRVTAVTTGIDLDPDGYRLQSIGRRSEDRGPVAANGSLTIGGLAAGEYIVELRDVAANCDVVGGHAARLTVASGDTVAIVFAVACAQVTQLVYAGGEPDIYVINSNGTGATRLTRTGVNREPSWSPDGSRIVFTSKDDIYVMDADGSNERRLTTHAAADYQPAWSPDGSRIAFVREGDGGTDLYVMNVDGTDQQQLTMHFSLNREPAWSPDGRKIAFSSDREGLSIYVMNADGTGVVRLTTGGRDESPAWSPDGTRIAFTRDECRNPNYPCLPAIHVMDADGSGVRWVATGRQAAWSADGRRIAYAAVLCDEPWYCYGQTERIRIVHADGDERGPTVVDLTRGMHDSRPDWRR